MYNFYDESLAVLLKGNISVRICWQVTGDRLTDIMTQEVTPRPAYLSPGDQISPKVNTNDKNTPSMLIMEITMRSMKFGKMGFASVMQRNYYYYSELLWARQIEVWNMDWDKTTSILSLLYCGGPPPETVCYTFSNLSRWFISLTTLCHMILLMTRYVSWMKSKNLIM